MTDTSMDSLREPSVFYLATGDKTKMYTLRARHQNNTRDGYIRNLSTDFDKAVEKAKMIFSTMAEAGDILKTKPIDLKEITRRSHEEMEALREEARLAEEKTKKEREERELRLSSQVNPKIVVRGKYSNMEFDELYEKDPEYAWWMHDNFKTDYYMYKPFIQYMKDFMADKQRPFKWKKSNSNHVGEIDSKVEFEAVVEFKTYMDNGFGSMFYKFRLSNGDVLVTYYSGSSWSANKGDTVKGVGTIKAHKEFDDEKQTVLKRVKLLEIGEE